MAQGVPQEAAALRGRRLFRHVPHRSRPGHRGSFFFPSISLYHITVSYFDLVFLNVTVMSPDSVLDCYLF